MSTYIRAATVPEHLFDGMQATMVHREDNGLYFVISPGDAIHRVHERDGLPHIYPGQVMTVKSGGQWLPDEHKPTHVIAEAKDRSNPPRRVSLAPIYAGDIMASLCDDDNGYKSLGVISIAAFAKKDEDYLNLDLFNSLLMPEPVYFTEDEVPPHLVNRWRQRPAELLDLIAQHGGLGLRERFAMTAREKIIAGDFPLSPELRTDYIAALNQILAAYGVFRSFATGYIGESDSLIRERQNGSDDGKKTYDNRDARYQWLLKRRGIDSYLTDLANPQRPVVNVAAPDMSGLADAFREMGSVVSALKNEVAAMRTSATPHVDTDARADTVAEAKTHARPRRGATLVIEPEALTDES